MMMRPIRFARAFCREMYDDLRSDWRETAVAVAILAIVVLTLLGVCPPPSDDPVIW